MHFSYFIICFRSFLRGYSERRTSPAIFSGFLGVLVFSFICWRSPVASAALPPTSSSEVPFTLVPFGLWGVDMNASRLEGKASFFLQDGRIFYDRGALSTPIAREEKMLEKEKASRGGFELSGLESLGSWITTPPHRKLLAKCHNHGAFVALFDKKECSEQRKEGKEVSDQTDPESQLLVVWGTSTAGGSNSPEGRMLTIPDHQKVVELVATQTAFGALLEDGRVFVWGEKIHGGSTQLEGKIKSFPPGKKAKQLMASNFAFTAILEDGGAFCWGYTFPSFGALQHLPKERKIVMAASNIGAFAFLLDDGSLFVTGNWDRGGSVSSYGGVELLPKKLWENGVRADAVLGNDGAFVAHLTNGDLFSFGDTLFTEKGVYHSLEKGERKLERLIALPGGFVAECANHQLLTWGYFTAEKEDAWREAPEGASLPIFYESIYHGDPVVAAWCHYQESDQNSLIHWAWQPIKTGWQEDALTASWRHEGDKLLSVASTASDFIVLVGTSQRNALICWRKNIDEPDFIPLSRSHKVQALDPRSGIVRLEGNQFLHLIRQDSGFLNIGVLSLPQDAVVEDIITTWEKPLPEEAKVDDSSQETP